MKKYNIKSSVLSLVLIVSMVGVSCDSNDTLESMYDLEIKNAKSEIERFEKEYLMQCTSPGRDDYQLSDWRIWGMGLSFGFSIKTTGASYSATIVDFDGSILGDNLNDLEAMKAKVAKSADLELVKDNTIEQWIAMYREFIENSQYPEDYTYRTIPLAAKFAGPYSVQTYSKEYSKTKSGIDKLVKSYMYTFRGETFVISGLNKEDITKPEVKKKYLIDLHTAVANLYAHRNGMAEKMKEITGKTDDDKSIYTWYDLESDEVAHSKGFVNKTAIVGAERDFSETFRYIITHTKAEVEQMKIKHTKLKAKIDLVLKTYSDIGVHLFSLKI